MARPEEGETADLGERVVELEISTCCAAARQQSFEEEADILENYSLRQEEMPRA